VFHRSALPLAKIIVVITLSVSFRTFTYDALESQFEKLYIRAFIALQFVFCHIRNILRLLLLQVFFLAAGGAGTYL